VAAMASLFGLSADREVLKLLQQWDTDGDGVVSLEECAAAARTLLATKTSRRRWSVTLGVLFGLYCVSIGVLFGLCVWANKVSRDVKVEDSQLVSTDNQPISILDATTDIELFDLLDMPLTKLRKMNRLYFALPDTKERAIYTVTSVKRGVLQQGTRQATIGLCRDKMEVSPAFATLHRPGHEPMIIADRIKDGRIRQESRGQAEGGTQRERRLQTTSSSSPCRYSTEFPTNYIYLSSELGPMR